MREHETAETAHAGKQPGQVARGPRGNRPPASSPLRGSEAFVAGLQRTAGNGAVVQLLGPRRPATSRDRSGRTVGPGAVPRPASGEGRPVLSLQRKIGFELETGIPLGWENDPPDGNYWDIDVDEIKGAKGPGGQGRVDVDHTETKGNGVEEKFGHLPIIELVTAPLDERLSSKEVKAEAKTWVKFLQDLRTEAKTNPAQPLKDQVPTTPHKQIVLGLPNRKDDAMERIAPQATVGVKLSKVKTMMSATDKERPKLLQQGLKGADTRKLDANTQALASVQLILQHLKQADKQDRLHYKQAHDLPGAPVDYDVKELEGFLLMVSTYLRASALGRGKGGYLKNLALVFFKSKLSSVRTTMAGRSAYAAKLVDSPTSGAYSVLAGGRDWLKGELLAENHVNDTDELLEDDGTDPAVSVGEWLDEVLGGVDDKLLMRAKNPWSDPIDPEVSAKGNTRAIMELRHLNLTNRAETSKAPSGGFKLSDTDALVSYLASLHESNKSLNK